MVEYKEPKSRGYTIYVSDRDWRVIFDKPVNGETNVVFGHASSREEAYQLAKDSIILFMPGENPYLEFESLAHAYNQEEWSG